MLATASRQTATVAEVRRELARQFRAAGLDAPNLDARILVAHALRLDHARLAADAERALTEGECQRVAAFAARRLTREPVARIVGFKEFWGLPIALNADALIPRPDSETVVEAALAVVGENRTSPLRLADLGTGSGALLLALLSELPAARGVGTDLSTATLACARANAAALGMGDRASFAACDQGTALAPGFDLIVANPPYVATGDIAGLAPEVRDFDPPRALDGGADGLAAYRAIAADARRLLAPDGALVVEIGAGQLEKVTAIFTRAGLAAPAAARCDLGGVPRALTVKALP